FGSDLHAAAASVAEKNKVPYLGVAFALKKIHEQGFRYLFSPFWKSPDIGEQLVGFLGSLPAAARVKTVAIFQEKTDWGAEMTRAGALDREKLRAAVAATEMTTVEGPVKFRPDGTGIVQSVFVQWINGKQELVWPRESATTPVVYPAPPFAKR